MTRVLLLRHAESEWNAVGRWQGQADPALSDRGRSEAQAFAPQLAGVVDRIVTSDLERAAATADIIAEVVGLRVAERDPALREIDVGEWSGLTNDEIEARWPGAMERWRRGEDPGNGGEDRSAFRVRILTAVQAHARRATTPLLVVTHGAAIGVIERHLDVHPGLPVPKLAGRWFELGDVLTVAGERILLADEV